MKKTKKLVVERTTLRVLKSDGQLRLARGGDEELDSHINSICRSDLLSESSLTTKEIIIRDSADLPLSLGTVC